MRNGYIDNGIVSVKYDDYAVKAIFSFSDGFKLYIDYLADPKYVLRSPNGPCRSVDQTGAHVKEAEWYDGGCGDEQTMSGPDHAEWRRAFKGALTNG